MHLMFDFNAHPSVWTLELKLATVPLLEILKTIAGNFKEQWLYLVLSIYLSTICSRKAAVGELEVLAPIKISRPHTQCSKCLGNVV